MSKITTEMVMALVLAELQGEDRHIGDLSPQEIKAKIDAAITDLRLAENAATPNVVIA